MIKTRYVLKKMIDFNKETFISMYNTFSYLQKQTENIIDSMIDQNLWLPEQNKKNIKEWSKTYKNGLDRFKKNMEIGYEKIENLVLPE